MGLRTWLRREETNLERIPVHETMRIGLCLTFIGGFLEVYTYLLHGGVFANAQTGNLVLLAIFACRGDAHALYYLAPIGAFFAGVLVSEGIRSTLTARQRELWQHAVVLFEAVLLAAVAFLPDAAPDAVIIVTISFICSLQFNSFRKTHGLPYATTFCTGNLRSASENFYHWCFERDRERGVAAARYFAVIGVFVLGAFAGFFLTGLLGKRSILLCSALALGVFSVMLAAPGAKNENMSNRKKSEENHR